MLAAGFEELVAIVEHGSLTRAAEALGMPRPTMSKRLARLEERLGVRLLHRTTRRMSLTGPGEVLYEKARRVVHAAREAEAAVQRLDDVPRGLLRVAVPAQVPEATFTEWLAEFLVAHPEVSLDVVRSHSTRPLREPFVPATSRASKPPLPGDPSGTGAGRGARRPRQTRNAWVYARLCAPRGTLAASSSRRDSRDTWVG